MTTGKAKPLLLPSLLLVGGSLLPGCGDSTSGFTGARSAAHGGSAPAAQAGSGDAQAQPGATPLPASGAAAGPAVATPTPGPPPPPQNVPATSTLFWDLPCAKAPMPDTPADPMAAVISGPGDFLLAPAAGGIKLEIAGRLCDSARETRDVVFVIDESESMRNFLNLGNDPLRSGTCGRNDAVAAVVKSLPADARVAFVTFDQAVKQDSAGFLAPADFLSAFGTPAVFCALGGGTDYQVAFARTLELLAMARPDASKEVYFLSDGDPDSGAMAGLAEATSIRAKGTLATVMLNGADPTLMQTELASRDGNGVAYYVPVTDVATLAMSLAGLTEVHIVSATLDYGPLGQPGMSGGTGVAATAAFDLTGITLDQAMDPGGFTLSLQTLDSRNVKTLIQGRLLWKN